MELEIKTTDEIINLGMNNVRHNLNKKWVSVESLKEDKFIDDLKELFSNLVDIPDSKYLVERQINEFCDRWVERLELK